jgi:suppressor for copper-sensitivity B
MRPTELARQLTPTRRSPGRLAAAVLALLVLALAPQAAGAAASDWARNEQAALRLIAAGETVGNQGELRLGLDFDMAEGWKIYWRSPGEAGYPPEVDWSGSENLADATIHWPVPHRFELFGLQTFGYGKRVVLPVTARAQDPGEPVRLKAKVDYLTCADICVPRTAELALTLPPGAPEPAEHAHRINTYMAQVPGEGAAAGLSLRSVRLTDGPGLVIRARAAPAFDDPDAVIEGAEGYRFGKPEVRLEDGGARARLRLPATAEGTDPPGLAGQTVTLTLFDGERGLAREITLGEALADAGGPIASAAGGGPDAGTPAGWRALAGMLGLAVLGGLILNLMPCVLPVLSLKLIAVVNHGGAARRRTRIGFLASAAGILVSFLGFGVGAIVLQGLGTAVGWGMQFQQPAFLVAMTLVVSVFACNLFGLFEIPMPRTIARAADRMGGDSGLLTHFLTGVLATLLATPCSAPFLGTAVGFALSRGAVEILAIFTALGVGLALPYLAVAAAPGMATALPRPGKWMLRVKQVMGLALAGTGVWLLTVLAAQRGVETAVVLGALVLAGALLITLRARVADLLGRRALPAMLAAIAVVAFATPPGLGSAPAEPSGGDGGDGVWRTLDAARIDTLVDAGKVVFVDVTAEWCITCKVNKAAVIETEAIQRRLDRPGVVRMRGDWTRRDDRIADYLARFERYGVPFNAVYGPEAPEGITLPEVLTQQAVTRALAKAR